MTRPTNVAAALPALKRLTVHLGPYMRRERLLITGSAAALMAEAALRLLEPWPLKIVFDHVLPGPRRHGRIPLPFLDGLTPMGLLTLAALAVVTTVSLRALAAYANTVGFAIVSNRVLSELRGTLYRHLQRLSIGYFSRARGGDLLVRVISDVGMLQDVTVTAILPLLGSLLVFVGMMALMLHMHWQLALLSLATVPLFWMRTLRLGRRLQDASRDQRRREGAMASTASESIGAIRTVQALSLEEVFARTFSKASAKSLRDGARAKRLSAGLERSVDVMIAISTASVLWYGARLVLAGVMSGGDLLVFLAYLKAAMKPAQDLAKYTGRLAKASAAAERVLDVLEREPEIRDRPGAVTAPRFRGHVRIEHVSVAYEPERRALEHVDLELLPGQWVALTGPSGSGKSTLAGLLLRLYDPADGRVLIDGHDVRDLTLDSLRGQVSVVLQDTLLFAASVRDNIGYGAAGVGMARIEEAARLANAHEFIAALPQGYETVLGERGVTLSSGQRQRIAIARAAVRASPLLVLDEPTTGLDEENAREVGEALQRLGQGRTTLLVTHDLHFAARCDTVLYLEQGRVCERGTHAELLRAGGRYAASYRRQSGRADAVVA